VYDAIVYYDMTPMNYCVRRNQRKVRNLGIVNKESGENFSDDCIISTMKYPTNSDRNYSAKIK